MARDLPPGISPRYRGACIPFVLGLVVLTSCAGQYGREHDPPAFSRAVPAIAKPMAQLAGAIKLRRGRLTGRDEIRTALQRELRPFDVVFLSAPYKGTSLFIPGHFSHVGIWLGEESDWKGESLPPRLHSALANRESFFHADRDGVRFSGVDEILDADHVAIARPSTRLALADTARKVETLSVRDYDFNFDGIDRSALLCTELILDLLEMQPVSTSRFLGRLFATPDQLFETLLAKEAKLAIGNAPGRQF